MKCMGVCGILLYLVENIARKVDGKLNMGSKQSRQFLQSKDSWSSWKVPRGLPCGVRHPDVALREQLRRFLAGSYVKC